MELRDWHSENTYPLISVMEEGIWIDFKDEQEWKTYCSIIFIEGDI